MNTNITKATLLALAFLLLSCNKVDNFLEIDTPRFSGNFATESTNTPDEIKLVSFNIEFGIKLEEALEELQTSENLRDADIILLQEMDEIGTETIAQTLEYNYVYYPSNRNLNGSLFGLAILSKWPILNDEKLLLPHATPVNERKRIAMTAEIMLGDQPLRIYNIHASTLTVPKANRREQFEIPLAHLSALETDTTIQNVIVAGDFNTDKDADINYLVGLHLEEGFLWASEEVGPTFQIFSGFASFRLDHAFTRGFDIIEAGKNEETRASDHVPIWLKLRF